jgi:hypothetical protein
MEATSEEPGTHYFRSPDRVGHQRFVSGSSGGGVYWQAMSPKWLAIDFSRLDLLAEYLGRLGPLEQAYTESDFEWVGVPGSQAHAEFAYSGPDPTAMEWLPRIVRSSRALIRLLVTCMAEQALSLGRLLTDPGMGTYGTLAPESCARSALELGARAWWLTDPSIGAHERVCRYLLEQLHSAYAAEAFGVSGAPSAISSSQTSGYSHAGASSPSARNRFRSPEFRTFT